MMRRSRRHHLAVADMVQDTLAAEGILDVGDGSADRLVARVQEDELDRGRKDWMMMVMQ